MVGLLVVCEGLKAFLNAPASAGYGLAAAMS